MIPSIILVVIFIGVLITIHEIGHLVVAKLGRIPVEAFSLGFGPVILKRKIGETEYRLSIVPLGGYIKMVGEEEPAAGPTPPPDPAKPVSGYMDKPLGIRVAVIAAGPLFNLLLGFLLMFILYLAFGVKYLSPIADISSGSAAERVGLRTGDLLVRAAGDTIPSFERFEAVSEQHLGQEIELAVMRNGERLVFTYHVPADSPDIAPLLEPVIDRVRSRGPAARLGLRRGDRILSVAGTEVTRWDDFVSTVMKHGGQRIAIVWERNGTRLADSIVPAVEKDQMSDERFGQIGVWVRLPKRSLQFHAALWEGTRRSGHIVVQTFEILFKVITGRISTRAIGGPIMVAKVAYEGASWGPEYFLALWALLSINLFVVNMLPIPVMDGGRILLDLFGAVRRRRLSEKELTWAGNIGWLIIGLLIVFTIFNDILRLVRK